MTIPATLLGSAIGGRSSATDGRPAANASSPNKTSRRRALDELLTHECIVVVMARLVAPHDACRGQRVPPFEIGECRRTRAAATMMDGDHHMVCGAPVTFSRIAECATSHRHPRRGRGPRASGVPHPEVSLLMNDSGLSRYSSM